MNEAKAKRMSICFLLKRVGKMFPTEGKVREITAQPNYWEEKSRMAVAKNVKLAVTKVTQVK